MSMILTDTWGETAGSAAEERGAPLPRDAVPVGTPAYMSTLAPGQAACGSVILPVNHWNGVDSAGQETGDRYTQYTHVIVSDESLKTLADKGIVSEETKIYHNFHNCREDIRHLNDAAHGQYLENYADGSLSRVRTWREDNSTAQTVMDIGREQAKTAHAAITASL